MMKQYSKILFISFLLILSVGRVVMAQNRVDSLDIDTLRQMWKAGQYKEVIVPLIDYRNSPYGKNLEIDYMLATSLCRVAEFKGEGLNLFRWILYHYNLTQDNYQKVNPN